MKKFLMLIVVALLDTSLYAQDKPFSLQADSIEYAIVYTDCGSFGGFCIYYEDGSFEDFYKDHKIKKPSPTDTDANARLLLIFLKYMRSKNFVPITALHTYHPNELLKTSEYIFSRKKIKP